MSAAAPAAAGRPGALTTAAYVAPFLIYAAFLVLQWVAPDSPRALLAARTVLVAAALAVLSRGVIRLRPAMPAGSVALGLAVFAVWVGPDLLWPAWRGHWIFQNAITGQAASSIPESLRADASFLALRVASSVLLVPILEELFWRGWLMRWLIRQDFTSVPPGAWTASSFWIAAALFASEHGPYWEVGLAAGLAYNWWIVRTRSLADCILAHAVTNGCLAAYVLLRGEWRFWL